MPQIILVVEDDPFISDLLIDVLSAAGYEVKTTDSAFGAAALVRELRPSAVLLDIGLPFRPGTDLLEELKSDARTVHVPVVVVSGLIESLSEERRALAAAVLAKPIDIERLLDALLQACAGRQGTGAA
jgi:two-component system repressor protein LuxO